MNTKILNMKIVAGFSSTFIGNGLGRFAYVALIPLLIQEKWFSSLEASYLGVSALFGYLIGAYICNHLNKYLSKVNLIRYSMLLCSLSSLLCFFKEYPIIFFYILRIISGITGAILMILGPSTTLSIFHKSIRGKASGFIFSGIGSGIIYSSLIIPLLFEFGASTIWISIGVIGLILTKFCWNSWQDTHLNIPIDTQKNNDIIILTKEYQLIVLFICIAYMLNAIGYLPHTLFWTDYLANELNYSLNDTSIFWAVFGLGAFLGPIMTGVLADFIGIRNSLIISFSIKAIAVLSPMISNTYTILSISSFLVGIFTPGTAALISAYLLEKIGKIYYSKYWARATFYFSLSQFVGGYLMALIADEFNSYTVLFYISFFSLIISTLLIIRTHKRYKNETFP